MAATAAAAVSVLAHPGIELRLSFSRDLVDLSRDGADVAIRFGSGRYQRSEVIELAREVVGAVCSPQLLTGRAVLSRERTRCDWLSGRNADATNGRRPSVMTRNTGYIPEAHAVEMNAANVRPIVVP